AAAAAIAFSVRFPVGLGHQLEPDLGVHADWPVLAAGATVVAAAVIGAAALAAWRVTGRRVAPTPVRARVTGSLARVPSLPLAIGAGLALERGRSDRALPVRPALAGAVAGILGIVGALGLVHGIDDALHRPARSGQEWDAVVYLDPSREV